MMALHYCYQALSAMDNAASRAAMIRLESRIDNKMKRDFTEFEKFFPEKMDLVDDETIKYLTSWHLETVVLPQKEEEVEPVILFDPLDEKDDRFWEILHPTAPTAPETEPTTAPTAP